MYKKGKDNLVANALSRRPNMQSDTEDNMLEMFAVSATKPVWLDKLSQGYAHDVQTKLLLEELAEFYSEDGIIRFKGKIWLSNNIEMQKRILLALHSSVLGGHSRFPVSFCSDKNIDGMWECTCSCVLCSIRDRWSRRCNRDRHIRDRLLVRDCV